ncbi:MAG: glycosyltransferase family 2 protein [Planctomycetes bacterium]|nr:glycosyltransferase family 2 protein [Planctomycetota bacterium]
MRTADLSVVIANRNHARLLPRALDAVLSQSLRPREVIVFDDDSTDDSVRVLERYAARFPCVSLIRNECHRGVTASYNQGFALATGKYILPGGADDYILPGFVAKAMTQFEQHPEAGVCVAYGSCTEGDAGPLIVNDPGWCERPTYFSPEEVCRRVWHTLPVSAIVVRADAIRAAGGYRKELAWYSDWFAFLVVAFRHGIVHLPETLGVHVLHKGSYATNARSGTDNVRILGALLNLLMSAEYADVVPFFRRNGAACHFGPDLLRAASKRADRSDATVLALLAGFAPAVYETLATTDDDATVRELAAVFLQDPWREIIARRADLETENRRLVEEIQLTRLRVAPPGMFGKVQWASRLLRRRLRKAVGLHPAGRFR